MSKAFTIARGKILRGEVTRIGQLITPGNYRQWAKRIGRTPGFVQRRIEDPRRWRLVDAYNLADLLEIEPERVEAIVNAEIDHFARSSS